MVTGNKNKAAEVAAITGWAVESVNLDLTEIQSLDVETVAAAKALAAYAKVGKPVIVDDTGMAIESLNGLPGAFVAWFLDALGPSGVLDLIKTGASRRASVSTCIGYADERGARTFVGTIHGALASEPKGANGFGYDPIFIPDGQAFTYAEMTNDQKNEKSMRAQALIKLKQFLDQDRA